MALLAALRRPFAATTLTRAPALSSSVVARALRMTAALPAEIPGHPTAGKSLSAYEDNGFDVGDDLDQAVGLQHAELVADLQDKPFFQECLITGPFGTAENPVKIESTLGYRIVGCTGGEGDAEHDVAWFELHLGRPVACDCCGQVFELVATSPPSVEWSL